MYSTNTQSLKQSYIVLYFAKKWELGPVIDWNVQIYMDIWYKGKNRTILISFKVNISFEHLYSSTQPEISGLYCWIVRNI